MKFMEIKKFERFLDGGTIKITTNEGIFCFDHRINNRRMSLPDGRLYLGMPKNDNSNLIKNSRELEIRIIESLKLFKDDFYQKDIDYLIRTKKASMLEKLKKYFETTPREKVLEDWAKTEAFDQVGPTMDEFLKQTQNNIENNKDEDWSNLHNKQLSIPVQKGSKSILPKFILKLFYLILKKDMIRKLQDANKGEQFIDDVMKTFEIPTNFMNKFKVRNNE